MTIIEKLSLVLILLGLVHAGMGIFNVHKFFSRARRNRYNESHPQAPWPGISILVPIKGPVVSLETNIGALFDQNYLGPLELILAFQDHDDESLAEAHKVLAKKKLTSKVECTILAGLPFLGLNPKNSNLVYAYRSARHPWLYICDADTQIPTNFLHTAMQAVGRDPSKVATAMTVHENPKNWGACLEAIGTNVELITYFSTLFNFKHPRQPLSGASQLMSRELFERVDAPRTILNQLTDDIFLEEAYFKNNASIVLLPLLVRAQVPEQTFKGFLQRQVRWMSIFRCYRSRLYLLAPLFWYPQWLLLLGGLTQSPFILCGSALVFSARIVQSFIYQIELQAPKQDKFKSPILVVYDLLVPLLWICGLLKRRIEWAGMVLNFEKDGLLVRE
jgi:hypothetical protein